MPKIVRVVRDTIDEKSVIENGQAAFAVVERGTSTDPCMFVTTRERSEVLKNLPGWELILNTPFIQRYKVTVGKEALLHQLQTIYGSGELVEISHAA